MRFRQKRNEDPKKQLDPEALHAILTKCGTFAEKPEDKGKGILASKLW